MYVINKEGIRLDLIYFGHDRFLEDIDDYIAENYFFKTSKDNPIELMDVVCGHLNYWKYKTYSDNQQAKLIYDECFQQNEIINRLIKIGDPIPELVIYEFDGISVYDELNDRNVIEKETYETIEINLDYNGILILTAEEFEDLGGEITLPEEEDDELYIDLSCNGDVYFFMTDINEKLMGDYMIRCVGEINKIYSSLGLPLIELTD
jgi:hypothetical protein